MVVSYWEQPFLLLVVYLRDMQNKQFTITIQRVITEDHTMVLEAEDAIQALDVARKMVEARNKRSAVGVFTVMKVEEKL
jgi:hypothetical protein